MISIQDKHKCCGCSACMQRCPKQCISMQQDAQGFLYPAVDKNRCIDCKLCEKVCPIISAKSVHNPLAVFAVKNANEDVRMSSSSGGVFTSLAEFVVDRGGVVFGALFNDRFEVVHDYVSTKIGITKLQGSKYVQSKIGKTFKQAETFLKEGRLVLYSGTPCQIAGLKKYLRFKTNNLITVEIVCHGVPSPLIWEKYVNYVQHSCNKDIGNVLFRDKCSGWRIYSVNIVDKSNNSMLLEKAIENVYMNGFLKNLFLRPSCFDCKFKIKNSEADFTIGDFWGVEKFLRSFDDNRGVSVVMANTEHAKEVLEKCVNLIISPIDFSMAWRENLSILMCTNKKDEPKSVLFWNEYNIKGLAAIESLLKESDNNNKNTLRHRILLKMHVWKYLHALKKYIQFKMIQYGK